MCSFYRFYLVIYVWLPQQPKYQSLLDILLSSNSMGGETAHLQRSRLCIAGPFRQQQLAFTLVLWQIQHCVL